MSCLSAEKIYMYLEKELSPPEEKRVERHLSRCLKCRNALEERKFFLQAVEGLPSWQVPANFSQQVMDRIFPVKVSLWEWLSALAGGFLTFLLALTICILATGQNLASLFLSLQQTIWGTIKNSSLVLIKFFKVISVFLTTVRQLLESLFKGLLQMLTVFSLELQILLISILILASFLIIYGMRRKFLIGEKQ